MRRVLQRSTARLASAQVTANWAGRTQAEPAERCSRHPSGDEASADRVPGEATTKRSQRGPGDGPDRSRLAGDPQRKRRTPPSLQRRHQVQVLGRTRPPTRTSAADRKSPLSPAAPAVRRCRRAGMTAARRVTTHLGPTRGKHHDGGEDEGPVAVVDTWSSSAPGATSWNRARAFTSPAGQLGQSRDGGVEAFDGSRRCLSSEAVGTQARGHDRDLADATRYAEVP